MLSIAAALADSEPAFSFEFFPPKTQAGEDRLWDTINDLEPLDPTFVSVTYGAGGSSQERTARITARIARETSLRPMAHLTCVAQSVDELRSIIASYADAGIEHVLALRGDPEAGVGQPWLSHPGGLDRAVDLVSLVHEVRPRLHVGVAAFPEGHPDAADLEQDVDVLIAKERAGAEFGITQFFYRLDDYAALIDRLSARGSELPIVPGVMPIESITQVARLAELSGSQIPDEVVQRLRPFEDDPESLRKAGIELATELSEDLLGLGAPGLHFYTLNRSRATREIHRNLTGRKI